ncbi:hypothetical protein [Blastomonas fulva]|uniref:hypothetical protein n=1 Tax=Blastomonas fulva TaxID=1550728 RepID=UPI0013C2FFAA|nr:hypothetical protein [Blastomonas fulva]
MASFVPLGVSLFAQTARTANGTGSIWPTLDMMFGKGQMYLMAYALFGTIFWLAFWSGDKEPHKARRALGTIALLAIAPVVGGFAVDPTFSNVTNTNVVVFGYYFYAVFAVIYYLLLFYVEIDPPTPNDVFKRETGTLINEYKRLEK